jgi:uncharacterized protein (DUF427 family)
MTTDSATGTAPRHNLRLGPARMEMEPSARWVRVQFGGATIADSTQTILVRETRNPPRYYFPRDDVVMEALAPSGTGTSSPLLGQGQTLTVRAGGREAVDAAWSYDEPPPEWAELAGRICFEFRAMDAWYEEEEQIYSHPRDPYHRVDVLPSSRHVEVIANGVVVADTRRPRLLFETGIRTRYYIPREDVRLDLLVPTDTVSRCPYKGQARYWRLVNGNQDIAWCYEDPLEECPKIKGLIAFWDERVDAVRVDGVDLTA